MDKADGRRFEDADQRLVEAGAAVEAVSHQTAMDGAAGELLINPAAITSVMSSSGNCRPLRCSETSASSTGDSLIIRRLGYASDPLPWCVDATAGSLSRSPQFGRQAAHRTFAALDIGSPSSASLRRWRAGSAPDALR